ncbi:hypothetical protein DTO166G4_698 [Paecilomyces variotii]|nr:hypothetical protein DTO032I3_8687 [Paecilomyces variotii]KAJ9205023.1 hypothetical protein DTO164E3_1646 [Paecilomyces variotii]KAJ9217516.1 hypothetical protein DTO166G4_698 [Paecilomyces variotii]KAJ9243002.1 hypothetical protein DTO166G5_106 [Paecilomyces variotii]KAJ9274738.1 hypothetical protein DTO021D3_8398 [Paecilomyces variotii]
MKSAKSISYAMQDRSQASATIDYLYTDILEKLRQADLIAYETAVKAFSWLLCMQEPLSCAAIIEAVSTGVSEKHGLDLSELLAICSNLIVVDSQLDTLRFAHVSFKEFLETKREFDPPEIHNIAVSRCLETCMNCLPIEVGNDPRPARNYSIYAVMYWARHYISSAQVHRSDNILEDFIFGDDGLSFQLWLEVANQVSGVLPNDHILKKELNAVASDTQTPLFTACIYGLKDIFHRTVGSPDFNVNSTNLLGHTGLYLAAAFGHHEIVQHILDLGGDLANSSGHYRDPLAAASANGHVSVVNLLLNQKGHYTFSNLLKPALETSFLAGREEIAKTLLSAYLQNSGQESGESDNPWLLEAAAQAGLTEAMDSLTKSSSRGDSFRIVHAAIRKGQVAVFKRYIEKDSLPADVIATAALFGRTEIITTCLDKGYDIEKEGNFGTPLRCASLMGHEIAVRTLLSHGADVNATTELGDTLQTAAMKGHLAITQLLIRSGASVNNQGGFFGNALQAAAYRGHRDVAEALLDAGASISEKGRYKDAFHAAAEAGQEELISLFCERGYCYPDQRGRVLAIELTGTSYKSLLRQSSPSRDKYPSISSNEEIHQPNHSAASLALVSDFGQVLQNRGSGVVSQPAETRAAYQARSISRHEGIEDESYALEVAASRGYLATVRRILAKRDHLRLQPFHTGQALWAASEHGFTRVVELITSVETNLRTFVRGSLQRAARNGHLEIIEILLRYEDIRNPPSRNQTEPIHPLMHEQHPEEEQYRIDPFDSRYWFQSPYCLPLVISGCRGNQSLVVIRGFQLAGESERAILRKAALEEAIIYNSTSVVELLLEDAPQPPEVLAQLMKTAAANGSKSAMELLLTRGEARGILAEVYNECLRGSISGGHGDFVQYLIQQNTSSCSSETLEKAFVYASQTGNLQTIRLLAPHILKSQASSVTLGRSLVAACAVGQRDIAEWLINAGADVNEMVDGDPGKIKAVDDAVPRPSQGEGPRTALQTCLQALEQSNCRGKIALRQESLINLLLENGADVNQVLGYIKAPLHLAVQKCSVHFVRALIAHGADVNTSTPEEGSVLQCAAKRKIGSFPIVHALINAGAIVILKGDKDNNDQNRKCSPVLNAALSFFGENRFKESGHFIESKSVKQVLSSGPGAVIKLLLLSQPELCATAKQFGLLLQMLAVEGDCEFIRLLIERGVDVNSCGNYYGCALQAAARHGRLACVRQLLDAGAEVDLSGGIYHTALQAAIIGGHDAIIRELIAHGVDVSQALPLAAEAKDFKTTSMLLDAGADVSFSDSSHSSALITACGHGDMKTINLLIERGADVTAYGTKRTSYGSSIVCSEASALHAACANGHYEVARMLLEQGVDPEQQIEGNINRTPLAIAALEGHLELLELLLESGARVYDPPRALNALVLAVRGKRPLATIEFFCERLTDSPDLLPAWEEALRGAFHSGNAKLFRFLLSKIPQSLHAFALACRFGSKGAIKKILSHDVNVDVDLENGERALHLAIYYHRVDLVSFLIDQGADVQFVSSKYGSPLSAALEGLLANLATTRDPFYQLIPKKEFRGLMESDSETESDTDADNRHLPESVRPKQPCLGLPLEKLLCKKVLQILLRAGSDVNPESRPLGPPLHVAAYIGEISMVKLLVEHGADLNATGGYFESVLIAAMAGGQEAVFEFLLARGVNPNIHSEKFGSALHYACQHKDRKAVLDLLQQGADVNFDGGKFGTPLTTLLSSHECRILAVFHLSSQREGEMLDVLLQCDDGPEIRDVDLILAARSEKGFLERLLGYYKCPPVTYNVISAVVASEKAWSPDVAGSLEMLLDRANGVEITPELLNSVKSVKTLEVLLQHRPRCEITSEIFEKLAKEEFADARLAKVLLHQDPRAVPTPAVIVSFLQKSTYGKDAVDTLNSLLDRNPEIEITDSMLLAVNCPDQLRLLLSRHPNFPISDSVLGRMAFQICYEPQLLDVIFKHDPTLKVGPQAVRSCLEIGGGGYLELLLQQDPSLAIPSDLPCILNEVIREYGKRNAREVVETLARHGKTLEFTPEMREYIDEQSRLLPGVGFKNMLLRLEKND